MQDGCLYGLTKEREDVQTNYQIPFETIYNIKYYEDLLRNGASKAPFSAHTHMVYRTVWIGNHQCNILRVLENILRHPV